MGNGEIQGKSTFSLAPGAVRLGDGNATLCPPLPLTLHPYTTFPSCTDGVRWQQASGCVYLTATQLTAPLPIHWLSSWPSSLHGCLVVIIILHLGSSEMSSSQPKANAGYSSSSSFSASPFFCISLINLLVVISAFLKTLYNYLGKKQFI